MKALNIYTKSLAYTKLTIGQDSSIFSNPKIQPHPSPYPPNLSKYKLILINLHPFSSHLHLNQRLLNNLILLHLLLKIHNIHPSLQHLNPVKRSSSCLHSLQALLHNLLIFRLLQHVFISTDYMKNPFQNDFAGEHEEPIA